MDKLQSPFHQLEQPTYSSILNKCQRSLSPINFYHKSPFEMIIKEQNPYFQREKCQQDTEQLKMGSNRQFVREDLHRNPLAQSVDGGMEMQNSQVVSRCSLNPHKQYQYLRQYEILDDRNQQEVNKSYKDTKNTYEGNFQNILTNQNPHKMSSQNKQSHEKLLSLTPPIKQNSLHHSKQYLLNSKMQNQKQIQMKNTYNNSILRQRKIKQITEQYPSYQILTNSVPQSYDQNISLSNSANQQISQVKYRLNELMKKFPMNQLGPQKDQQYKKKQFNMVQNSAPQLYAKRSVSFQEAHSNGVLLNFTPEQLQNQHVPFTRPVPSTQMKITVPLSLNQSSSYQPSNNFKYYQSPSLNYSQSTKKNHSIHLQTSLTQSLYKQISQQQQVIAAYKKIIFQLQNDNTRLSSLLNQIQTQQKQIQNQTKSQKFQNILQQPQSQILNFQQDFKSVKINLKANLSLEQQVKVLQSQKSELLKKITWLNCVIEEMINNNSKKTEKSSQQSTPILISQNQPSHKNSHQQQHSQSNRDSPYQTSQPHSYQNTRMFGHSQPFSHPHSNTKLESVPVQTSFIDPITQNFDQFNYKRLYEKEIGYQQRMKQQMHELEMIQLAYDQQFNKVLQEIHDIKKHRQYYQQLKIQIQKQKQRSKSMGQNSSLKSKYVKDIQKQTVKHVIQKFNKHQNIKNSKLNHIDQLKVSKLSNSWTNKNNNFQKNINDSSQLNKFNKDKKVKQNETLEKRIFQNQIIYQLKNQNEILKKNLYNLTNQLITLKKHQNYIPIKEFAFNSSPNFPQSLLKNSLTVSFLANQENNQNTVNTKSKFDFHKIKQRPNSKISIVDKLKKRHQSFVQIPSQRNDRINSQNKSYVDKIRKNGAISYLSSSCLSQIKNSSQLIRKELKNKSDIKTVQRIGNSQNYHLIQKKSQNNQILQEKSQNCTEQSSRQVVINRYNNFIKSMKKRFGINSQIIGKEIGKDSLNISVNKFQ